jgi:hypothetical protein
MGIVRNRFFKWGAASLVGHLAMFELFCGSPLFIWALMTMRSEGTLTTGSALRVGVVCVGAVAVATALFWYSVSAPLKKTRDGSK